MPNLDQIRTVRPDPVLSRLAVELGVGGEYIDDIIAPAATVESDTFKYSTFGREEIQDDTKIDRAPGVGADYVKISQTHTAGAVNYYSLNSRIPDETSNNAPSADEIRRRRVHVLTSKLKLGIAQRVFTLIDTATNTSAAPSTKWDAASPDIRGNILADIDTFRQQSGFLPTHLILPPLVARVVFNDTSILDLLKHTDGGKLADSKIPVIENMAVLVPGLIVDSSAPGASASIGDIYSKDEAYYLYVDSSAGNDLGATTALRQVRSTASTGTPFAVRRWRDPDVSANSEIVNVEVNQTEVTVSNSLILTRLDVLT